MEDSFKVRVDRAFGSLEASSSSTIKSTSSSLSSLWCLTDEEIKRNEWIQDKITVHKDKDDEHIHRLKTPKIYSSFLQGLLAEPSTSHQDLESDIQELEDEEDEEQQPPLSKPDDHSNDDWNIRSSVGMDCTLDNEEEEDGYDKVALGREESTDRFYMRDVNDYEVEMDSNNELPDSITDVIRDPRANHMAAKLRLKEDEESARKLGLQVSENNNIQESTTTENQISTPFVPDYGSGGGGGGDMETEDVSMESQTSIVFTPRKKKSSDDTMKKSKADAGYKKVVPAGIAGEDVEDSVGVCVMDEDEAEMAMNKQRGGRRYRTKASSDVE
ncbi:uncharacterized protein LOC111897558 isoform X2 [Lactuca sativa]|uniref:uncharacterized protein LOC111897558 isoform X2 n=1 Tax=Lactuca sativa TaxID=4236 RepID=UPI000CD84C46|nr:uncharacterized protein LOC111897558 isoform X2 [Lactuca sativa]